MTNDRLVILHGGQTGVDRGAHLGALTAHHLIEGYMPRNRDDEYGPIPPQVAKYLKPALHGSWLERTEINIDLCHALLVIVENTMQPYATPGTAYTLQRARRESKRSLTVGPDDADRARAWLQEQVRARHREHYGGTLDFRLMVAGPRASRWSNGERAAFEIVRSLEVP